MNALRGRLERGGRASTAACAGIGLRGSPGRCTTGPASGARSIAAAIALAGCASGGAEPSGGRLEPSATEVVVRIRNDYVPRAGMVVSVRGGGRPQRVLGILRTDETGEWLIDTRAFAGGFILIARIDGRRALSTRPIQAVAFSTVTWDLNSGIVRVRRDE